MALRPAREAAALATPSAAPAGSIANSHPTRADLDGLKVLVAEDNPINQEVALAYLQGFGCRSSLAANGLEAIEACERSTFDIVLMDCQMPEVDGLAAIRHIRAREKRLGLTPTPIVMVTANAFASDREQALSAGADDFLSKPYSEDQLLQLLASAARRRAA
jgi:CheY-like chemotaxis protein